VSLFFVADTRPLSPAGFLLCSTCGARATRSAQLSCAFILFVQTQLPTQAIESRCLRFDAKGVFIFLYFLFFSIDRSNNVVL